uniref:Uncharacterized protein n=1 Tax=Caenorhabditis japonica TaxID=281687 RepID=A0A8R1E6T4_CAEJA
MNDEDGSEDDDDDDDNVRHGQSPRIATERTKRCRDLCNHTTPGTERLSFPGSSSVGHEPSECEMASFTVRTRAVSNRLRTSDFRS